MPETEIGSGLENIRARRRFSLEVILVAIGLSFIINVLATSLLNWVLSGPGQAKIWMSIFWASLAVLIVGTAVTLYFVLWHVTEFGTFALTLGIRVDKAGGEAKILHHGGYGPARITHELFSRAGVGLSRDFAKNWPGQNPIKDVNFGPGHFCWEAIEGLVHALLVIFVNMYGNKSLTHSAMHESEFRHIAGRIPKIQLPRSKWPAEIRNNEFLIARGLEKLLLPKSARLRARCRRQKPRVQEISVETEFGDFTFSISPYWTVLRDRKAALGEFKTSGSQDICFLRIPVDLKLSVRGIRLSHRGIRFSHRKMTFQYLWFKGLAQNVIRRMDWAVHLKKRDEA